METAPAVQKLSPDQETALSGIIEFIEKCRKRRGGGVISLSGPAGSGKTFLIRQLWAYLRDAAQPLTLCATTGKAARRLSDVVGKPASTLHAAIYRPPWVNGAGEPVFAVLKPQEELRGVVACDEASMLGEDIYEDMLHFSETIWVLIGDHFQIPPVQDASKGDWTVFGEVKGFRLTTIHRHALESPILAAATHLRTTGKLDGKLNATSERGDFQWVSGQHDAVDVISDRIANTNGEEHVLLTWTNKARSAFNQIYRGLNGIEGDPQPGEPIVVCENSSSKQHLNGDLNLLAYLKESGQVWSGTTKEHLQVYEGGFMGHPSCAKFFTTVPFQDKIDWSARLNYKRVGKDLFAVQFGYCLTAHKAQGSEYDHGTILMHGWELKSSHFNKLTGLPDGTEATFRNRWLYTAITRFRKSCHIYILP